MHTVIEIRVPRRARVAPEYPPALDFDVGRNGRKVRARLRAMHPHRLRGRRVRCEVVGLLEAEDRVILKPTGRAKTHHPPRYTSKGYIHFETL